MAWLTLLLFFPWFVVLAVLIGLNEVIRLSKWTSLLLFIVLPLALTPVWILFPDPEIRSWFYWVKVYSALAGSIIFMVIRFTDFHKNVPDNQPDLFSQYSRGHSDVRPGDIVVRRPDFSKKCSILHLVSIQIKSEQQDVIRDF